MNWTVSVALFGWIPLVAIAFAALPPRRAVLVCMLGGWMFLPVAGTQVLGFFDYSKSTAVPLIVFLAALAFDGRSWRQLRFRWADLPMAAFCAAPGISSLANDLGGYDAASAVVYQTITWGLSYLLGRVYFFTPGGLRELAWGLVAAGLVYAPLCLWEVRMSPQLHATLYGFHQHDWLQTLRSGGYRPMVFMHHGLMVGLWMTAAALVGIALAWSGERRQILGIPLSLAVPGLVVTSVLCKSFGALLLLAVGAFTLASTRLLQTALPLVFLVCVPPGYVAARVLGSWSGNEAVEVVGQLDRERAGSLAYRIEAEEQLRDKALEKPVFGWGGWGRSFVRRYAEPERKETVTTDSLWILVLGKYGVFGLVALLATLLAPVVVLWRRCPPTRWALRGAAFPWALALVLTLYAVDNLVNAMTNPVYLLIAGGLSGIARVPNLVAVGRTRRRGARNRRTQGAPATRPHVLRAR